MDRVPSYFVYLGPFQISDTCENTTRFFHIFHSFTTNGYFIKINTDGEEEEMSRGKPKQRLNHVIVSARASALAADRRACALDCFD